METGSHVHRLGLCRKAPYVDTVCVACRARVEVCECEGVTYE